MKDPALIAKFRSKVEKAGAHGGRITLDWPDLERLLDLAAVALRYRRLAAARQKRLDRARKNVVDESIESLRRKGDLS